jgi:hypothetical protein
MPEYNAENRKLLAQIVVDAMSVDDLCRVVYEMNLKNYEEDQSLFEEDWEFFDPITEERDAG